MAINPLADNEPPLWLWVAKISKFTLLFFSGLLRRVGAYLVLPVKLSIGLTTWAINKTGAWKRSLIRLLLFRGGIFHQAPRLGLTALVSATAFSVVMVPAVRPISDSYALAEMLTGVSDAPSAEMIVAAVPQVVTPASQRSVRTEKVSHTVAAGETLGTIAELYLVSTEGLKFANNLNGDLIRPGDTLTIPPVNGLFHTVKDGDTLLSIASLYGVPAQAIADFNYLEEPFDLSVAQELIIPDAKIPQPKPAAPAYAQASAPTAGLVLQAVATPQLGTGGFIMPVIATLTQYFWWGHTAVDLANSCGTPIVASDSGTVTFAGWWPGGGGNSIWIDHGNGYTTQYAHMSGFAVTGGAVERGQVIGYIGTTGRSTGCHLHFIVQRNGVPIDPLSVL